MSRHYFWTIVLLVVLGVALARLVPSFFSQPRSPQKLERELDSELNDEQQTQPAEIGHLPTRSRFKNPDAKTREYSNIKPSAPTRYNDEQEEIPADPDQERSVSSEQNSDAPPPQTLEELQQAPFVNDTFQTEHSYPNDYDENDDDSDDEESH